MSSQIDNVNITFDLIKHAKASPRNTALILNKRDIDYQNLNNWVWQSTQYLYAQGVREGDVVGTLFKGELKRIIYSLGVMRLGATLLPLASSMSDQQRNHFNAEAGTRHIVTDTASAPCTQNIIVISSTQKFESLPESNHGLFCEKPANACLLVPGSGSSGYQKLIPQTHAQIRHRCSIAFPKEHYTKTLRVASLTTLAFAAGINRLLSVLHVGGAMAVITTSTKSVRDYCEQKAINTLFASVFHIEKLLANAGDVESPILQCLESLRLSGSNVSMDLRKRIRDKITPNLHIVYGANECGRISLAAPPNVYSDDNTVGYPLQGIEIEIVDAQLRRLARGETGQIRVRTPSTIVSYLNDASATEKHFKDGWFYTGDIGELNEDGQLRHFGRSDNMMIVNGINIHPREIEQTVKQISGVSDAVALSIKHPTHQDIPVCAVSLESSAQYDVQALKAITKQRLGFKSPQRIIILDKIPRNGNGKVQANALLILVKNAKNSWI